MSIQNELYFEELKGKQGDVGQIILNRPTTLNALTHEMSLAIERQLIAWQHESSIKAVVIYSNVEKAFCVGGDLRHLYDLGKNNDPKCLEFFWDEYRLNRRIHNYPKPYIALLDGITMGGGVGISLHGSHRVGASQLQLAMPETGIGFFPDIGGSFLLSRCPGQTGTYLGLTGDRVDIDDACFLGWIDYFVPRDRWNDLLMRLTETKWDDDAHVVVDNLLHEFSQPPKHSKFKKIKKIIDKHFSYDSVEDVLKNLKKDPDAWAQEIAKILLTKSPMSLKVTLREIRKGTTLDLDDCLKMEYCLAQHFIKDHDFYEGVRSIIIDKDQKSNWKPNRLDEISEADVENYFKPLQKEILFFDD